MMPPSWGVAPNQVNSITPVYTIGANYDNTKIYTLFKYIPTSGGGYTTKNLASTVITKTIYNVPPDALSWYLSLTADQRSQFLATYPPGYTYLTDLQGNYVQACFVPYIECPLIDCADPNPSAAVATAKANIVSWFSPAALTSVCGNLPTCDNSFEVITFPDTAASPGFDHRIDNQFVYVMSPKPPYYGSYVTVETFLESQTVNFENGNLYKHPKPTDTYSVYIENHAKSAVVTIHSFVYRLSQVAYDSSWTKILDEKLFSNQGEWDAWLWDDVFDQKYNYNDYTTWDCWDYDGKWEIDGSGWNEVTYTMPVATGSINQVSLKLWKSSKQKFDVDFTGMNIEGAVAASPPGTVRVKVYVSIDSSDTGTCRVNPQAKEDFFGVDPPPPEKWHLVLPPIGGFQNITGMGRYEAWNLDPNGKLNPEKDIGGKFSSIFSGFMKGSVQPVLTSFLGLNADFPSLVHSTDTVVQTGKGQIDLSDYARLWVGVRFVIMGICSFFALILTFRLKSRPKGL